jgi:tRNA-dihydrouridine synthase B
MTGKGLIGSGLQIGRVNVGQGLVLAPMAGITDLSFRLIARRFGADLVTSEMVSAEGVLRGNASTQALLRIHPEERPLALQLFGGEARAVAEATRIVVDQGVDIIDLNMGCAVQKVIRQGAGAALLLDPGRAGEMVAAVRRAVTAPLTIKIRSGWSREHINAVEVARRAEGAGADAVTVHPRTARQGFSGAADWDVIARVKAAVSIPVIGNGDVRRPEQVEKLRQRTGCDGVMIGRAAKGNPWIFREAKELAKGGTPRRPLPGERLEVLLEHVRLLQAYPTSRSLLTRARSLLIWYSGGCRGSGRLRATLAGCRTLEGMLEIAKTFFATLGEYGPGAEFEGADES